MKSERLKGKIAVVTGSSRGIGKGIATALGSHGATVYVTGRTAKAGPPPFDGTVFDVAEKVTAAGGKGIPVVCDFADDAQIAALFKQVGDEQGQLHILVNNACALPTTVTGRQRFWEQPIELSETITVGLRSSYIASWHAAPLLLKGGRGLVVNTSGYGSVVYFHNPPYGIQKAGQDKLASDLAVEFRDCNVATASFWYSTVGTERHMAFRNDHPEDPRWEEFKIESPEFSGHVIERFYNDPEFMAKSGNTFIVAELAAHYDLPDEDGSQPPSWRDKWMGPWVPHPPIVAK